MGACLSRRTSQKEPPYGPKVNKRNQLALPECSPAADCVDIQPGGVDILGGLATRNMDHVILDILVYLYPDSLVKVRRVSRGWREAGDRVLSTQVARRRLGERRLHGWKHGVEREQVVPVNAEISRTPRVHLATQVVACGGRDGCANVYKLGTGASVLSVRHCSGDGGTAVTCCDIGDTFLVTGTEQGLKLGPTVTLCPKTGDGRVRLWDRGDGSLVAERDVAEHVRQVKLWGEGLVGEGLVVALGVAGDDNIISVMRQNNKELQELVRYQTTWHLQDLDCDAERLVVGYTGVDDEPGGVITWDKAEFVGDSRVEVEGDELEAHRMDWCSGTVKRLSLSSPWLATAGDEAGICVWSLASKAKVLTCFPGRSFSEVRMGPRMLAAVEAGGKKLTVADWVKMWQGVEEEEGPWQREIVPGGRAGEIGGVALTDTGIMYGESSGTEPSIEALLISGHGMVGVWVINTLEEEENYVIKMINFTAKEFRPLDYRAMFHK